MRIATNMCAVRPAGTALGVLACVLCFSVGDVSAEPTTRPAKKAKAKVASPAVMLEKGIYTEETLGDLDKAMTIYREIVAQAQANRKYVAQAQYRLGMCLIKKGEKAKGYAALRELISKFPDQKNLVAKARKAIPNELKLDAAPWPDGEEMAMEICTKAGVEVGRIVYTAKLLDRRPAEAAESRPAVESDEQKKYWRIESFMTVPVGAVEQYTRVVAEADSFAPVYGRTRNTTHGDFIAVYRPDQVNLTMTPVTGKQEARKVDLAGPVFDNEQAIFLIRRMPLAMGYEGSFQIFPVQSTSICECRIKVQGKETRKWVGGEVDTYLVDLQILYGEMLTLRHKLWISADKNRWLVHYDAGNALMKLTRVGRLSTKPQPFQAAEGVSLSRPVGWHYYVNPIPGEYKILVALVPPEFKAQAALASAGLPEAVTSARALAESSARKMKVHFDDYAIRESSWKKLRVGDRPAVSHIADYTEKGKAKVDYRTYVTTGGLAYWFTFRIERDKFAAERKVFDSIIQSLKVPDAAAAGPEMPARLPPAVMGYIIGEHFKAAAKAAERGVRVNTHIYGVDGAYNLYSGGFLGHTNKSDKPDAGPIHLGNFGTEKPDYILTDETGQDQKYELRQRETSNFGKWALWWKPDKPVKPGAKRLLGYLHRKTTPLPQSDGRASLEMKNTYGPAVVENFFLVVWRGTEIIKPSVEPTSKQTVGTFDIYLWQKLNPQGRRNAVSVTLKTRDTPAGAGPAPSEADKKEAEEITAEGWRLWNARKLPEAEAKFKAAVAKDPTNAGAFNGLGWSQLNQDKPLSAKDSFERAAKLNPKVAGAWNGLGVIAKGAGRTEQAIEYWQKAVEADPAATAAWSGLASTYCELGEHKKAIGAYQKWLKIEPNSKQARQGLEKALKADGRKKE